jgi:hypothetical protein
MRWPEKIIDWLATCLKPAGRLLFSVQALESNLPIRPYESVYVNEVAVCALCQLCDLTVDACELSAGRWLVAAWRNLGKQLAAYNRLE